MSQPERLPQEGPDEVDEGQLVRASAAGDQDAFRQLVERYRRLVLHVAFRSMGDMSLAEDVTQEAFIKVYRGLPRYRPEKPFVHWLRRVVGNAVLDELRRRRPVVSLDGMEQPPASSEEDPQDVTDQHAMEAQLIQSEKLAAVGQLVSGVAHELNNPLTSIAGLSEFLLEQKELGSKDRGHLRVIHEQADRAGRIVRNLLTFARKGTSERVAVDVNDVIERTLVLMSYDFQLKDIAIDKDLAPVPPVLGDRHALQQVVINLLTNAAQAVSENPPERPRRILLRSWADDRVRLRVADSGPGIPDDVLPHLFTPFFTTKEPGQGTGLGLSITYSIVEAHGGRIVVDRPTEGGAAFLVDLPVAPADPPRHDTPEPGGPTGVAAVTPIKRSILLVDDDPAVRRVVKALFGREGHMVEVARNPQHALDLVRTRSYDLILADREARAHDQSFVEQLVESHPELKERVVVATGAGAPAGSGTLRYVRKPFNLRDLREEAARVWAAAALS